MDCVHSKRASKYQCRLRMNKVLSYVTMHVIITSKPLEKWQFPFQNWSIYATKQFKVIQCLYVWPTTSNGDKYYNVIYVTKQLNMEEGPNLFWENWVIYKCDHFLYKFTHFLTGEGILMHLHTSKDIRPKYCCLLHTHHNKSWQVSICRSKFKFSIFLLSERVTSHLDRDKI